MHMLTKSTQPTHPPVLQKVTQAGAMPCGQLPCVQWMRKLSELTIILDSTLRIHGMMILFYTHHDWTIFSNKWENMKNLFTDISQTEKTTDLSKHLLWVVYLNVMLNDLLLQSNLRITWKELSKISKVFLVSIVIFAHINTVLRHRAKDRSCVLLLRTRCVDLHTSGKNCKMFRCLQ